MRRRWLTAVLAALAFARGAAATTFVPLTDAELVRHADLILTGVVQQLETAALDDGRIETRVTLAVGRALKGRVAGGTIVLAEPGGQVGDRQVWTFGVPEFETGESVLVFVRRRRDGSFETDNLALGKYHLDGRVAARTVPVPDVRHARRFLAAIARLAAGDPGRAVGAGEARALRGQTRASRIVPRFTLLGNPAARWFEPDDGKPVRYRQANTDAVLGSDSTAALLAAMAAWTDVPTASITLLPGAATTPAASTASNTCDGTSRIQFNDPFGEVPALTNCHGTLAIGGFCTNTETRTVGGITFRRITEGDVTLNDGFGACFTPTDAAEVLTHELGHTIGLGHSSNNTNELDPTLRDATMYFRAHFDGRGAALRADDIAGVAAIYPGDADGDGVGDGQDLCPGTLLGQPVDATGCACTDAGHASCDDGDPCSVDACDPLTAACTHTPKRCDDGDPCTHDSCQAGECRHTAASGTEHVTCYFEQDLACDVRLPPAVTHGFRQAAALVRRASRARVAARAQRLYRRAERRLARVDVAIDRATTRLHDPLAPACATALHDVVDEARRRVQAVAS